MLANWIYYEVVTLLCVFFVKAMSQEACGKLNCNTVCVLNLCCMVNLVLSMYSHCTVDVLVTAFESVIIMTYSNFHHHQPPRREKELSRFSLGTHANKHKMASFQKSLIFTLNHCFTNDKKMQTRREKMWEKYYQLRSTDEFALSWKTFLQLSGTEASPTLYQHITDLVLNHLISTNYTTQVPASPTEATASTIDYKEIYAIRYIAGYISQSVYRKLNDSKHHLKDELCLCLAKLNDIYPEDMQDESKDWMDKDRGFRFAGSQTFWVGSRTFEVPFFTVDPKN